MTTPRTARFGPGNPFDGAPIIHSYLRAQALADGELVDVTKTAREAGFRCPVAVTRAVLLLIEDIPASRKGIEDVQGRLWDVLWMAYVRARCNPYKDRLHYPLQLTRAALRDTARGPRKVLVRDLWLKLVIGPGDDGQAVITLMLTDQD
jgi:hypothetical protein